MMSDTIKQARARATTHPSRAQDTWDSTDVHSAEDTPWVRGQSLAAPPARPGFVQRWIRVAIDGKDDATNVARKMREGWKPRPADSIPANFQLPTISHGEWTGCLGIEGSVLMEIPAKIADKRKAFVKDRTDTITNSLEGELQQKSNSIMPISQERRSDVGRMVKVADD